MKSATGRHVAAGLLVAAGLVTGVLGQVHDEVPASQPATLPALPMGPLDPQSVNEGAIMGALNEKAIALGKEKKTTDGPTVREQLKNLKAQVALPTLKGKAKTPAELYKQASQGVLIVAGVHMTPKPHTHPAAGFVITESGVAVTNYHVMANPEIDAGFAAMTRDGRVFPVKAVLAASEQYDIAIIQLEGEGFVPLPIAERAEVGEDVFVISHPVQHFWHFTRGMVAGYAPTKRKTQLVEALQITADYAKGSSGSPILSGAGEVIGMVSSTTSVYYNSDKGEQKNLQMVFKSCVTARQILSMLEK